MIRRYRYDKETGKMVEASTVRYPRKTGITIIPDIKPYQAVGPEYGTWITSRSQHRAYLRRHKLEEVGNERKYFGLAED